MSKLGEGGMGTVWAAEHALLGRRAAVKVLLPELSARADIVERFFNEARASTAIGDLGVVQIFDFGYHEGSAYIVMELLEGESLDTRLHRSRTLPLREALRLTRQLAQTLATVHARGVIHRDLKPDNVFLVADGEAEGGERTKILDFGIAKLTEVERAASQTRTGSLMGTPLYMSPEQCRGTNKIDRRSDIYALGCVLFHMLCGRPPFEGEAPGDTLILHVTAPPPAPSSLRPGIPRAIDDLVLRCLAKSPDDRYADMTKLAQAVAIAQATITGADPASSLPGTAWRAPTPPPSTPTTLSAGVVSGTIVIAPPRRRALVAGAAVLAFAGAAAIGFAITRGGGEPARAAIEPAAPLAAPLPAVIDAGVVEQAVVVDAAVVDASVGVDAAPPPDATVVAPAAEKPRPSRSKPRKPAPTVNPYELPK